MNGMRDKFTPWVLSALRLREASALQLGRCFANLSRCVISWYVTAQ
jgi:hypothetical protein